jgi:hypothetical protein
MIESPNFHKTANVLTLIDASLIFLVTATNPVLGIILGATVLGITGARLARLPTDL